MKRIISPISPAPHVNENEKTIVKEKNKLEGASVWIMYMFTLTDDSLDIFMSIILLGVNIIPVAGQGLAAVLTAISTFLSCFITFVIFLYFRLNGVSLFSRKMAKRIILLAADIIPGVNILPMSTIFFYLTIKAENISRQHKTMMKLEKKFKV